MSGTRHQNFPSLSAENREALKASIRKHGVLEPILVNKGGEIIDGHHRASICEDLGIECPSRIVKGDGEEQDIAAAVNVARRQLGPLPWDYGSGLI